MHPTGTVSTFYPVEVTFALYKVSTENTESKMQSILMTNSQQICENTMITLQRCTMLTDGMPDIHFVP